MTDIVKPPSPQRIRALRLHLLRWYGANEQPFPWRTARDPYLALVAAVAAQQTQMSRVFQIYDRWIAAFPTLQSLAAAGDADALRVWGRAGYPRRALYLRRAAEQCVQRFGGRIPDDPAQLRSLPGVGPFTAAIVLGFGYGIDAAAIDTNIVRVIGRAVHGALQPALELKNADIAATAERLLPPGEATRWNPALMDFGAAVCTPRPKCGECPIAHLCRARPRFAAGERARPVRAQPAFKGSKRQIRGELMRSLREAAAEEEELIAGAASRLSVSEAAAREALRSLLADGLLSRTPCGIQLGSGAR